MTKADQREAEKPGSRWSPLRISCAGVNKMHISGSPRTRTVLMSSDTTVANSTSYAIVVPCFNERDAIATTVTGLVEQLGDVGPMEILVVDDGSNDGTAEVLAELQERYPRLSVEKHLDNRGYGAALKTGIRCTAAEMVVITDADNTYPNERIPELAAIAKSADMVVGARTAEDAKYSFIRRIPKIFLAGYAAWIAGQRIPDLNSGLRVMRRSAVERFLPILPDTFSFTTTITLAMLTNYYRVRFVPIGYSPRIGRSKIRPIRDTLQFFQLLVRVGMYFAPLRVFFPIGLALGAGFAASLTYDIFVLRNLTEKTLLLLLFGINTVMFALLADMIDKRTAR
jgi:glycosyltransferase involved in cell wall biosynthesis